MVDQVAVVQFAVPTSVGTLDITSPLITETWKAAIFIFSKESADNADNTHGVMGMGCVAVDGAIPEEVCLNVEMENGRMTSANCNTGHSIANCINVSDGASTLIIQAQYSATIAGGVRLNFSQVSGTAVKCVAILFAGVANAAVGTATSIVSPGNHANVGISPFFRPDLLLSLASDSSLNVAVLDAAPNIGFALDLPGTPQVAGYVNSDDAQTTPDSDGITRDDSAWLNHNGGVRTTVAQNTVAFDSTGFTAIESVTSSGGVDYLAIKWSGSVRMAIANLDVAASTGDQNFNTFGFTPELVLGLSTLLTAASGTQEDGATAAAAGYFVTGLHGSRAYTVRQNEGDLLSMGAPSAATSRQEDVAVLLYDEQGAIAQRATWGGAAGDTGFKLNFSTASLAGTLTALGLTLGHPFTESVGISETAVLLLAVVSTESMPISESTAMQVDEALSETVAISENVGSYFRTSTDSGDTVSISETSAFLVAEGTMPEGSLMSDGAVFQGTPQAAAVFVLGAAEGLVQQGAVVEGEVFVLAAVEGTVVTQ